MNAIASGKRPDYPVKELDEDDIRCWLPPVRCSGCGGMVYAPCRLCRVRAVQREQRSPANVQSFLSARMDLPNTSSVNDASPIKLDRCQVPANRVAADHLAVDCPVAGPPRRTIGRTLKPAWKSLAAATTATLREPLQHFSELLFGGQLLQLLPLFIGQVALLECSQLIEIYSPSAAETTLCKDLGFDGPLNPFIDQRQPRRPIARGGKLLLALRRKLLRRAPPFRHR